MLPAVPSSSASCCKQLLEQSVDSSNVMNSEAVLLPPVGSSCTCTRLSCLCSLSYGSQYTGECSIETELSRSS